MNKKNKVHFIGIGGIGISSLAQWFLTKNWTVSGSDLVSSSITQNLKKQGVKIKISHKSANLGKNTTLVIHTAAIPSNNPELLEAKRRKLKIKSYSEALGDLTKNYTTIAIAGAHGKSTTTALLSLVLINSGLDPTVIIGTKLQEFGKNNFRFGKSQYFIIEADEWRGSFLNYSPACAIITNIDREHLDFYKNFTDIKKAFLKFINNIKQNGILVVNKDDAELFSLKGRIAQIAAKNKIKVLWYSISNPRAQKIKNCLKIFGIHNVSNALAAYTLAKHLGIEKDLILKALSKYRGAWRRMEYRGKFKIQNSKFEIPLYDDYAHHPTEIKATLEAFREKFPKRKIICIFQPHQAKRLKLLFGDFIDGFKKSDFTIILPIYQVAGRDINMVKYNSETLVKAILKKYPKQKVLYLENLNKLKIFLTELVKKENLITPLSPIIIMMGAGDIFEYSKKIIQKTNKLNIEYGI